MKMNNNILILFALLFLTGCFRGAKFEEPPIHLNPNMDNQPKYRSLEESYFFEDGSTMRTPIEGTVAVGHYNEDSSFITGKNDDGTYLIKNPLELSMEALNRGEDRYNIYCIDLLLYSMLPYSIQADFLLNKFHHHFFQ